VVGSICMISCKVVHRIIASSPMQIFSLNPRNICFFVVFIRLFRMQNDCLELDKMCYWVFHEFGS
jgi:hypothetical protein